MNQTSDFFSKIRQYLQDNPLLRKVLLWGGIFSAAIVLFFITLIILVYLGVFGALPSRSDLAAIQNPLASEVYADDGTLLGRIYLQNRIFTPSNKIPRSVYSALVATEDARFFRHEGIDTRSYFRVLIKTLLLGDSSSGGGSTISQQLIKNLFPREDYGFMSILIVKIREALIAARLENTYNKEQILAMYLNTVSFGEDVYGIGAAAQRYFNITPEKLKTEEAATLIGMLKATTAYNPRRNPEASKQRRNVVLQQMMKYGYISESKGNELQKTELVLNYNRTSGVDGLAPHLREYIRQQLNTWCKNNPKSDGSTYSIYTDGLKIYTTINAKMQRYAEEAVNEHLSKLQTQFDTHWKGKQPWGTDNAFLEAIKKQSDRYKRLKAAGTSESEINKIFKTPIPMRVFTWQGEQEKTMSPMDSIVYYLKFLNVGFSAMDPNTGHIKAWVGSIKYKYFQYDHTLARRQVGSTFKPLVYAAALENEVAPCNFYANELRTYSDYQDWTPRNSDESDEGYTGFYSMHGAMAKSVNTVSVQVLFDAGLDNVIRLAEKLGIHNKIPELPSIALGTAELSLQEMVTAYCAFDNGGAAVQPVYLLSLKDKNGKLISDFNSGLANRYKTGAMSRETARLMTSIMQEVVENGTARSLRHRFGLQGDIAGKTGTTQVHADGWFIGYVPDLVAGVWVGGYNQYLRFRDLSLGQGAAMALPVWGLFMNKVYKDASLKISPYKKFPALDEELASILDCPSYLNDEEYIAWQNGTYYQQDGSDTLATDGTVVAAPDRTGGRIIGKPNVVPRRNNNQGVAAPEEPQAEENKQKGNFWSKIRDLFKK